VKTAKIDRIPICLVLLWLCLGLAADTQNYGTVRGLVTGASGTEIPDAVVGLAKPREDGQRQLGVLGGTGSSRAVSPASGMRANMGTGVFV
jgi:hypothetical protein